MSLQWLKSKFHQLSTNLCGQDLDFSCQGGIQFENMPTTKPITEQPTIINWMKFPPAPSMLRVPKPETRSFAAEKKPGEESYPKIQAAGRRGYRHPWQSPRELSSYGESICSYVSHFRTIALSLLFFRRLSGCHGAAWADKFKRR